MIGKVGVRCETVSRFECVYTMQTQVVAKGESIARLVCEARVRLLVH